MTAPQRDENPQSQDSRPDELGLRDRLTRLSQASLRINASLDFDTVLQGVLDSARDLTGADYGVITVLDEDRNPKDYLAAGISADQAGRLWEFPAGLQIFDYLKGIGEPRRFGDFLGHLRSRGLPELPVSAPVGPLLLAPIQHVGELVGTIFLGRDRTGREFDREEEEILTTFASQAALVIANARRFHDEQQARLDLETLIDTSPVGVMVFDGLSGQVVSANREARRIAAEMESPDCTLEQLLEVVIMRRADGTELSLGDFELVQALSNGELVRAEEITLEIPGGKRIALLVNATPIRSAEGTVESCVVTLQDLAPIEELERLRAEFLGTVSHELRTPLTSIRGSATALLDEDSAMDPAESRQFHRIILEQTDRMRGLINDLLDFAHIRSGTLSVTSEPIDVIALVNEARDGFLGAGGRNLIMIDLPPDLPRIMADRRRLLQVLDNLLRNAAAHSDEGSTINLRAQHNDLYVSISVTDQGRGIPAEQLPRLFARFSRPGNLADTGSGLGLAICKGLVEAHGGRIWAESDGPGQGARFTFNVPAVEESRLDGLSEALSLSGGTRRRGAQRSRVLAVDDDPHALRHIRDSLQKSGYNPVVTGDPGEVARLLDEGRPDLVLLDLLLPDTDGIELMRAIQSQVDVPVIFLSAYGQQENIVRALDMGAVDYIVKPFSTAELAARIRAALRKRSLSGLPPQPAPFRNGDLMIDYRERSLTVAGRAVDLTAREYAVLFELSVNPGRVMTHQQLLLRVWGAGHTGDSGLVRTIVNRLRRKMGDDAKNPVYILTTPGVGYRMADAD